MRCARAVRRQLAHGADVIKVMATGAMLSSETEDSRAIQYTLDELGLPSRWPTTTSSPSPPTPTPAQGIVNAVDAGVDSIEHCTFADDDALARSPRAGTFVVPTICAGELLFRDRRWSPRCPSTCGGGWSSSTTSTSPTIRRAHELGVRIAMGTDAGTPGNHHGLNAHECVFMVEQCGLSPAASIRAATVDAARCCVAEGQLGTLATGAYADVIALNANPLDDITELTRVAMVMSSGNVLRNDL